MPRTAAAADRLVFVAETGSTNTLARERVANGELDVTGCTAIGGAAGGAHADGAHADDGDACTVVAVVAADRQTAGRGRLDHTWQSRPGESSTVTYVVGVPRAVAADAAVNGWLQMIAGLATLDGIDAALAEYGARPVGGAGRGGDDGCAGLQLKWPNDIFLDGRKLGGILAELVPLPDDAAHVAIVFGVGLNLAVPADRLPTAQATSLHLHYGPLPDGGDLRDRIAAATVVALRRRLTAFAADPHSAAGPLRAETTARSYTLGRRAVAHFVDGSSLEGEAVALNADASITLRDDAGVEHVVRTGDVGVLPA